MKVTVVKLFFAILIVSSFGFLKGEKNKDASTNYVPNSETAKKIAEAIWDPIYGKNVINSEKPFVATLINDSIWEVHGTLPPNLDGGVAWIQIQKADCKVLEVYHGK